MRQAIQFVTSYLKGSRTGAGRIRRVEKRISPIEALDTRAVPTVWGSDQVSQVFNLMVRIPGVAEAGTLPSTTPGATFSVVPGHSPFGAIIARTPTTFFLSVPVPGTAVLPSPGVVSARFADASAPHSLFVGSPTYAPPRSTFVGSPTFAPYVAMAGSTTYTPPSSIFAGSTTYTPPSSIFAGSTTYTPPSSIFAGSTTYTPPSSMFAGLPTFAPWR